MRTIVLPEYQAASVADLAPAVGQLIWKRWGKYVAVDFPSPRTGNQWRLTSGGWVGLLPVTPELTLELRPKVPLSNVLRMVAVADGLDQLELPPGMVNVESVRDLVSILAIMLARGVSRRCRLGLQRRYEPRTEALGVVRGRLMLATQRPWLASAHLQCGFDEHTTDTEDNQLLLYALERALKSGVLDGRSRAAVVKSYRELHGRVNLREYVSADYHGRAYDRLNEDYRPLHALSRFLVDHLTPTHAAGGRAAVPFLVEMPRLFEAFVARWIARHLPRGLMLSTQDAATRGGLQFVPDLVIRSARTGQTIHVLDTKYKAVVLPDTADVSQVVAYAVLKQSPSAILVYPTSGTTYSAQFGEIAVEATSFDVSDDLDRAGASFLKTVELASSSVA